jgi:hypothetical protein
MPDKAITFPAWFRWVLGVALPGATLWATFVTAQVMQIPSMAESCSSTRHRAIENSESVEVAKSQFSEMNRRLIRIEDKLDKIAR